MQFTYDKTPKKGNTVAYIDEDGCLWIKNPFVERPNVILCPNSFNPKNNGVIIMSTMWNPNASNVKRLFYKGDKVTIEF